MAASSGDEVYERHVRPLSAEQRLHLLARIAADLAREQSVAETPRLHDPVEFYGVGRRSWDGSDAQEFINTLRDEWEVQIR